jgi:hypothetical protein
MSLASFSHRPRRRSSFSAVSGLSDGGEPLSDCFLHSTLSLDISRNLGCRNGWVFGPKGHGRIAQGLPWVIAPIRISPEGATSFGKNRIRIVKPHCVGISSPFRAKRLYRLTQGKPWAKLSYPFGAGPLGRVITTISKFRPWDNFLAPFGGVRRARRGGTINHE